MKKILTAIILFVPLYSQDTFSEAEVLKILEDNSEQCLKKNNNKANYCQEERYKYEKCHNFLKFVNNKII